MNSQNETMRTQNATTTLLSNEAAAAEAEVTVQTGTFEKAISVLQNGGYLVSLIYLLRVYYYFWSKGVYTLQKKNLLSLCVNLSALYSLIIVDMFVKIPNFLVVISCCEVTTTALLFIMSADTCLNLRRRARDRLPPPDDASDCKLFVVYTFCAWILSQGVAYTLAYAYDNFLIILIDFHLLCYTLILIMFFVSLYNIKPAATVTPGVGGAGASSRNFNIFGRTLIIAFVTSSIKFAFAVIFYATGKQVDLLLFLDCLMAYDGVFIYYCLTFNNKKVPSRQRRVSQIHVVSDHRDHARTNNVYAATPHYHTARDRDNNIDHNRNHNQNHNNHRSDSDSNSNNIRLQNNSRLNGHIETPSK